jgi:hypothetical protein
MRVSAHRSHSPSHVPLAPQRPDPAFARARSLAVQVQQADSPQGPPGPPVLSGPRFDFERIPILPPVVQRKPAISSPGDPHEREADEVAEQVMQMQDGALRATHAAPGGVIQRACAACEDEDRGATIQRKWIRSVTAEEGLDADAAVRGAERGGQPLPEGARLFMERRFGYDFSRVRVHADAEAASAAHAVRARAYTSGRDIVFGSGEYAPETAEGKHLLAHELTHVVQQGGAPPASGSALASGPAAAATSAPLSLQRQPAPATFDVAAKATEVEKLVRPGNDEAQALKKLDEISDMADLLAVVDKLYADADASNPDESSRRAYGLLSGDLVAGNGAAKGVNVARIKAAFYAAPNRGLKNPVGTVPGTKPTLSDARKTTTGIARPGDWGEDPDNNTWIMQKEGIRTYFRTSIPGARRSSAWMANNPGNADYVKSITKRAVGSFHWGKGVHDFAVYFDVDDGSADLRERVAAFQTIESYINAHLGNREADNNDFDTYVTNMQSVVPDMSTSDPTSKWTTSPTAWNRILGGFKKAEGWDPSTEGTTLTAASVATTPSDPKEAAVVDYYRARLWGNTATPSP